MEKNQYQKKKEADGYVVVEAAVLLPLASIFIVLLIGLCSYLYQGCFLMQAAYTVAFRSAAQERPDAGYADGQLNQLLEGEVLSFGKEERQIKAGMLRVGTGNAACTVGGCWRQRTAEGKADCVCQECGGLYQRNQKRKGTGG